MRSKRIKNILFYFLVIVMSVPLIQHLTHFSNEKVLRGAVVEPVQPLLSSETWFNGTYQDSLNSYLNETFGFRPEFVRLHNQVKYSLYNRAQAQGVIIGKDWYLYEYNYIRAYYGVDFVGDSIIQEKVRKIKFLQDTLGKLNKQLVIVMAPGKGSYLPEFIPDSSRREKGTTNYERYVHFMRSEKVNYVDFNRWFRKMKGTTRYPLYAKGGIHWSKYGEILAADSLIKVLEKRGGYDLPELVIDGYETSQMNKDGDYDIGEGMNLIWQTPTFPMTYPKHHFEGLEKNKNSGLVVADSYYWGMFNFGFSDNIFKNGQFWFYNEAVYPDSFTNPVFASDLDIRKEVEKNDYIILMSTDANLYKFAFGFVDRLYQSYQR